MNIVEKYHYETLNRITRDDGVRHYICPRSGKHLPSVTTILSRTSNRTELIAWRKRVGAKQAEEISREALALGTLMHTHLENYLHDLPRPSGNNLIRVLAEKMADQIIAGGLSEVTEIYGSEVVLYCPELFAGTTDGIGLFRGRPTMIDFKSARKMRSAEMIEDYYMQLAAYKMCHQEMFGDPIDQGVILMVDRDMAFKQFVIADGEMDRYADMFLDRFETYVKLYGH
jgi:CRISPR/Cas system-associated exonuclease Cas4 (RecB family)